MYLFNLLQPDLVFAKFTSNSDYIYIGCSGLIDGVVIRENTSSQRKKMETIYFSEKMKNHSIWANPSPKGELIQYYFLMKRPNPIQTASNTSHSYIPLSYISVNGLPDISHD